MFKKLCVIVVILVVITLSFIPVWSTWLASQAFENPDESWAQDSLKESIQIKMYCFMFSSARESAEKAIIYFPESKYLDYYIYTAALCAVKENKTQLAIIWFEKFVEVFLDHPWTEQAKAELVKLK